MLNTNDKHRWLRYLILPVAIIAIFATPVLTAAQENEEQPKVYAVLFFSPTCGHCEKVIAQDYPQWQAAYGSQFEVIFINVTTEGGNAFYWAAMEAYNIPEDQRGGVPFMFLGEHSMIGSGEIPERVPGLVEEGLENGGVPPPPIPGLAEAYAQALAQEEQAAADPAGGTEQASPAEPVENENLPGDEAVQPATEEADALDDNVLTADVEDLEEADTIGARVMRDPAGNGLAIAVLLGLCVSLVTVVSTSARALSGANAALVPRSLQIAVVIITIIGALVGFSLIFRASGDTLAFISSAVITLSMLIALIVTVTAVRQSPAQGLPAWLLPLITIAGLIVSAYMAYIEILNVDAACGLVGDCNTVQQSPYAVLFGVLPVAVAGIVGYAALVLAWGLTRLANERLADLAHIALLGMTLGGLLFSIYLTFLEPFVIGATCSWCISSALLMVLLFWLATIEGIPAIRRMLNTS